MPFVTTITLKSGDRQALDTTVSEIRDTAERKGIELKGPHSRPPQTYRVPLFESLTDDGNEINVWEYTVFERVIQISGHNETVRQFADWEFPPSIQVEVTVDRVRSIGSQ